MSASLTHRSFNRQLGGALTIGALQPQASARLDGEWPEWGHDSSGARFSPLDQSHRGNVSRLEVAWTHRCGEISDGSENPTRTAYECTPLKVNGKRFVTTPYSRALALDPETGHERWTFGPSLDLDTRYNPWKNRGISLWKHGSNPRVLLGTLDGRLIAPDARTGDYDWRVPLGDALELTARGVPATGTIKKGGPIATGGGLVFVASSSDRRFRAFDCTTGRILWEGELSGRGHANPMTYAGPESGRQFEVIAASGGNKLTDQLQAFALPV